MKTTKFYQKNEKNAKKKRTESRAGLKTSEILLFNMLHNSAVE